MILEICFQNFLLNKTKKETAKMIPHLAVSLLLTFLIPYTRESLLLQDQFPA